MVFFIYLIHTYIIMKKLRSFTPAVRAPDTHTARVSCFVLKQSQSKVSLPECLE